MRELWEAVRIMFTNPLCLGFLGLVVLLQVLTWVATH